ncbi:MAG: tRNA (N(6)-L-threonylcarbamoyladenosine(37)-C(2))-methylthiotransferase MtaB [Bacteroidales bacterium]
MTTVCKIAFKTLGCRLNQFETDALVSQFRRNGYEVVGFTQKADIYVINTCTVTNQGDAKSRKAIHQALRRPDKPAVVITGCMVDGQKEKLQQIPGVTYFVENARKTSLFQLVDAHFKGETLSPDELGRDLFGFEPADKTLHTRSYIKIQDGCNNFCTFCIVPKVRGRAISRPAADILENIRQVVNAGFREVVLTGVNIGRYDHEGMDFERLMEQILDLPGDFRVRISSIEPEGFGDRLFDLFSHPRLSPHLHLCLQSGSDRILLQMRRFYNVTEFMEIVCKLKNRYPDFNLTTDVIVGFPGESDEDFEKTCEMAREIGFSHIHTFKYSVRSGTRAERMPDQVPEKIKQERSRIIRDISAENRLNYLTSLIGKEQIVLVEKVNQRARTASGYGQHYVPVEFPAGQEVFNTFARIKLTGITKGTDPILLGEPY